MVLTLVGLGLSDEKDITVRGLEIVRSADAVYLEAYTAVLMADVAALETLYGRKVNVMYRRDVEEGSDSMLEEAKTSSVAFLVVGDPFCATTHTDLFVRARQLGIEVKVVHNASIMSAVSEAGLQLYRFGQTVSIPFFEPKWEPDSFYDHIGTNQRAGLHTLCLLDIKVKEQTLEHLMKNSQVYEPPRFMTIREAIEQMIKVESRRKEKVCQLDSLGIGIARMGSNTQRIISGSLEELMACDDFGGPMHSLLLCGPDLHEIEEKLFAMHRSKTLECSRGLLDGDL